MLMWRRTRKMSLSTFLLATAYWSSVAVESADLLQLVVAAAPDSRHSVFTVIAMVCIATVVANSYAVVTLCSYVSPITSTLSLGTSPSLSSSSTGSSSAPGLGKRFDVVYTLFVGTVALSFVQIPLISARCQILAQGGGAGVANSSEWRQLNLTGVFYLWLAHDIIQALAIPVFLLSRQCHCARLSSCGPQFDNTDVFFQPEKRDKYIMKRRRSSALNNSSMAARDGASIYSSNGSSSVRRYGSSSSAGSTSTANTTVLVVCEVAPSNCESSFDAAKSDLGEDENRPSAPLAIMPSSPAVAAPVRMSPTVAAGNGGVRERHSWIQQHQLQQQQLKNDAKNNSNSSSSDGTASQTQLARSDSVGSDGKRKTVRFITNGYTSVPDNRIQEESEESSDVV